MKGKLKITTISESIKDIPVPPVVFISRHRCSETKDLNHQTARKKSRIFSVDLETAITEAGYGKFNLALMVMAVCVCFAGGFASGSLSYVVPVASEELGITNQGKALLQSAPYFGMIFSASVWGYLSDTYGRRRLIAIGFLLDFCMNTGASLIPSFSAIFIFKILSGIMVSGPYSIFMTYIAEVSDSKRSKIAVLSAGFFSAIGNMMHPVMALLIMPWSPPEALGLQSWQYFLLASGFPSLVCGIMALFFVESPKFLAGKGRNEEALGAFRTIYTMNTGQPPTSYPVRRLHTEKMQEKQAPKTLLSILASMTSLLRPPYVLRAIHIFVIHSTCVGSVNVIRLWLPEMFSVVERSTEGSNSTFGLCEILMSTNTSASATTSLQKKASPKTTFSNMIIVNSGVLIGQFLFIILARYVAIKKIFIAMTALGAVSIILVPTIDTQYIVIPASFYFAVLSIGFFCIIGIVVEIFPTSVRATSVSLTMMFGRIGILLANFAVANTMHVYCDSIFYTMSALLMGALILVIILPVKPISGT